jgi:hypothetical protein
MTAIDLEKKLLELEKENKRLTDENESLWLMLDEIKRSEITEFQAELTAAYNEARLIALMKNMKPSEA